VRESSCSIGPSAFLFEARAVAATGAYPVVAATCAKGDMTTLPPDLYGRVVDRLRHAQQYAEAARVAADEALGAFRAEGEVVAMAATLAPSLPEHLIGRLRHAEQYAEAARLMAEEALNLLETQRGNA
jgi:4'-phosphopantetheinyl transferase EntD